MKTEEMEALRIDSAVSKNVQVEKRAIGASWRRGAELGFVWFFRVWWKRL